MVRSHSDLSHRNQRSTEDKVDKFIFNSMKKDKIYELRIDEEDELSGIDSISLVDEPAIEVNWVAFNKHKHSATEECFDIPDGEDSKYLEMLYAKGSPEQDLIEEGYTLVSIQVNGEEHFITAPKPNAPSEWNEGDLLIRYKYILDPRIKQAPIIPTTRDFCSDLLNKNFVWRVEDMDSLQNDFGQSAMVWRGGYNCRHRWAKLFYKKDTTIVNKGSITTGRVATEDYGDILGYPQPSTITDKTRANPAPSTVRNLGLSKQGFEAMDIFGFKPRYFYICPGAVALFEHLVGMKMDEDTVGMVRSAAQIADNVFRIEDEVLKLGVASQSQLNEAVVLVDDFKDVMYEVDQLVGMVHDVSFMDGHIEVIKKHLKEDMGYDVGAIGGYVDPGVKKKKKSDIIEKSIAFESYTDYPESARNAAKRALDWAEKNGWGSCGTPVGKARANQLAKGEPISEETISRMASFARHLQYKDVPYSEGCGGLMVDAWGGQAGIEWASNKLEELNKTNMSKQKFQTDEEKRMVVGPAMVPDLKIFRRDLFGNPYYVYFSADTIKMIAEKYMRNKYIDNNDENHNGKAVSDVYVVESWIKEDKEDKSNKYGYGDLPIGTWFVSMKVRNDEVWNKVKNNELRGFSVSGYFEEIAEFAKEHMFLLEVVKILNKYE